MGILQLLTYRIQAARPVDALQIEERQLLSCVTQTWAVKALLKQNLLPATTSLPSSPQMPPSAVCSTLVCLSFILYDAH